MTDGAMTHERCSELLGDYAGGRLDAAEAARVDAHLASCSECAAELRAVMALRVDDEPLDDLERARLRNGIRERVAVGDRRVAARPARRARLATALGVAALLAIGGVAVVSLGSGGDDRQEAVTGAAKDRAPEVGAGAEGGGNDGLAAQGAPAPRPSFDRDAGKLTSGKLNRLGKSNRALAAFSNSYSVADAPVLKDRFVEELADQATDSGEAQLIRDCANEVYSSQRFAALPAYAGRGTLAGREALVLGFAWTDEQAGALDQFMLWTWPSSSCAQPIDYRSGQIDPRD